MIETGQLSLDSFIDKQAVWVTQLIVKYRDTSLSIKVPQGLPCPQCGSATRQRSGKNGPFWSCVKYPECKGTLTIEPGKRTAPRKRRDGRKRA